MSNRGAELLALVYAEPAVDAHRLVYADWLMAQGDPRGEFIVLQFKRETQAGRVTAEERARERQLQATHGRDWLGALRPVMDPATLVFRKGFLSQGVARFQSDSQRQRLHQAPEWATVEKLAAEAEMLVQPSLASLWSVGPIAPSVLASIRRRRSLPGITEAHLNVEAWTGRTRERVFRALPMVHRLVLRYRDVSSLSWNDFQPGLFALLLEAESAPTLTSLHIRQRVLMPYPRWRDFATSRPDLNAWSALCRGCTNGVHTVRLVPCRGWHFTLRRRDAGPWQLVIDWHTMSATGDIKTLDLALARTRPTDFAGVRVRVHGYCKPHHRQLLARQLARFSPLTVEVVEHVLQP